jgi:hypothetical protein
MPHLKQGPKPLPPWFCALCEGCAEGWVPVAGSIGAASIRPGGSAVVMFAAAEHLASASGTAAVASEIGGAAFASASACDSSTVA